MWNTQRLLAVLLVFAVFVELFEAWRYPDESSDVYSQEANDARKGKKVCRVNNKKYKQGETIYIPIPFDNLADAQFKMCECRNGQAADCYTVYCDSGYEGVLDCKQASVLPGDYCPSCRCISGNGKRVRPGKSWIQLAENNGMHECAEFKCEGKNKATLLRKNYVWCDCSQPGKGNCCKAICKKSSNRADLAGY